MRAREGAVVAVLVGLAAVMSTRTTLALPPPGADRPALRLRDAWERSLELSRLGGEPVLVVYEDKDSSGQNDAFKAELATLARGDRYKASVALVAVADVQGYDYWPVRGFVKEAIRNQSRKFGTPIYCDWDGAAQRSFGLRRGVSNVILYGREGKVLFSHEGPMSASERHQAIELLRAQVEG